MRAYPKLVLVTNAHVGNRDEHISLEPPVGHAVRAYPKLVLVTNAHVSDSDEHISM